MNFDTNNCRLTHARLDRFKNKLTKKDSELLSRFELLLTETELEIRGGSVKDQNILLKRRFSMQKIATSYLNVEVAIYGSVYSFYATDRIGVFI